jgi:hypothetical protein
MTAQSPPPWPEVEYHSSSDCRGIGETDREIFVAKEKRPAGHLGRRLIPDQAHFPSIKKPEPIISGKSPASGLD